MSLSFTSIRELHAFRALEDAVTLHSELVAYRKEQGPAGLGVQGSRIVAGQIADEQRKIRRAINIIRRERWVNVDPE